MRVEREQGVKIASDFSPAARWLAPPLPLVGGLKMSFPEGQDIGRRERRPQRTAAIMIRVTPQERDQLAEKARARKSTLARFIRESALRAEEPTSVVTLDDRVTLARIGGNLNQVARALNVGESVDLQDVRAILQDCRIALDRIARR